VRTICCEFTPVSCEFTPVSCKFAAVPCEFTPVSCEFTPVPCEFTPVPCEFTLVSREFTAVRIGPRLLLDSPFIFVHLLQPFIFFKAPLSLKRVNPSLSLRLTRPYPASSEELRHHEMTDVVFVGDSAGRLTVVVGACDLPIPVLCCHFRFAFLRFRPDYCVWFPLGCSGLGKRWLRSLSAMSHSNGAPNGVKRQKKRPRKWKWRCSKRLLSLK
jgi:hypothetical protein